jgi:hypothetical protein
MGDPGVRSRGFRRTFAHYDISWDTILYHEEDEKWIEQAYPLPRPGFDHDPLCPPPAVFNRSHAYRLLCLVTHGILKAAMLVDSGY